MRSRAEADVKWIKLIGSCKSRAVACPEETTIPVLISFTSPQFQIFDPDNIMFN